MFDFDKQAMLIKWLQGSTLSEFHSLFLFLRHFDTTPYYLILGAILVVFLPNRHLGVKYIVLLCLSAYTNHFLKRSFDLPRPGAVDSSLDLINLSNHFGFPSGAAMGSVLIGAIFLRHLQGPFAICVASIYIFLVCCSRIYLGVHFPVDIVGGLVFGLALWGGFVTYEKYLEKKILSLNGKQRLLILVSTLVVLNGLHPVSITYEVSFLALGLLFGSSLSLKNAKRNLSLALVVAILGVCILFLTYSLNFIAIKLVSMFLLGFWLSYGSHLVSISAYKFFRHV